MSYILEALKKSQHERELGQVPTLEKTPLATESVRGRPGPWLMAAVGLAMLAVLIALYAALRVGPSGLATTEQAAVPPESSTGAASPPVAAVSAPATAPAQVTAPAPELVPAAAESAKGPAVSAAPVPDAEPSEEPELQAPATAARSRKRDGGIPSRPAISQIPEDLRHDVEAFKEELRQERAGSKDKQKPRATAKASEPEVPAQELRLPADVRKRLPRFLMSAHVYDKTPAKRFVLINTLKTREGETSREGIKVEEILPDGAVLSYAGHRFFQAR